MCACMCVHPASTFIHFLATLLSSRYRTLTDVSIPSLDIPIPLSSSCDVSLDRSHLTVTSDKHVASQHLDHFYQHYIKYFTQGVPPPHPSPHSTFQHVEDVHVHPPNVPR